MNEALRSLNSLSLLLTYQLLRFLGSVLEDIGCKEGAKGRKKEKGGGSLTKKKKKKNKKKKEEWKSTKDSRVQWRQWRGREKDCPKPAVNVTQ